MIILLTGAGGNLGRALIPMLAAAGHIPRLMDLQPLNTPHDFVQGDVRDTGAVRQAVAGVDAVVHAAALHGIHLKRWTPHDFWAINVSGTFNVFEAAREAGVMRMVLCSTMGVYGQSAQSPPGAWSLVTESAQALPGDVYGLTKLACEEMGRYYGRRWGLSTVALRLGMFVPVSWERYGFRLLFGGVDDRDAAQAVLLALGHTPPGGFDFFNIHAEVPFTAHDLERLYADPAAVIEQYWPGSTQIFAGLNLADLIWGRTVWPPDKARRILGYRPKYNFAEFREAYQANRPEHYPFANLPWWGV